MSFEEATKSPLTLRWGFPFASESLIFNTFFPLMVLAWRQCLHLNDQQTTYLNFVICKEAFKYVMKTIGISNIIFMPLSLVPTKLIVILFRWVDNE